jgi:hypothetical protein
LRNGTGFNSFSLRIVFLVYVLFFLVKQNVILLELYKQIKGKGTMMSRRPRGKRYIHEGLITAIAVGGFLISLGLIVVTTPGIMEKIGALFSDITWVSYPFGSSTAMFPAPANPALHIDIFTAFMNFILAIGIIQIVILPIRLIVHSPIGRIAETLGNLIFWVGATVAANIFLLVGTLMGWFQFWSWLIVLAGLGLIVRFGVLFIERSRRLERR